MEQNCQQVGWVGKPNYSTAARVVSSHETDLLIDNMSNYSPQQTESREQDPTYRWTDLFGLTVLNAHLQERPSEVPLPPYSEHPDHRAKIIPSLYQRSPRSSSFSSEQVVEEVAQSSGRFAEDPEGAERLWLDERPADS